MSEHENSSAKISLLYMGWIVAAFSLGTWFGHFGLPLPFNKIPSRRAKEVETVRPIESIRQKKTPKKVEKAQVSLPPQRPKAKTPEPKVQARQKTPPPARRATQSSPKSISIAELPSIAFDRLSKDKRALAIKLMNKLKAPCGCGQSIAQCAKANLACPSTQKIVEAFMESVFKNLSKDKIKAAVLKALEKSELGVDDDKQQPTQSGPKSGVVYHIPIKGSPAKGPKTAKITVVLFSDFECPYCSHAEKQVKHLQSKFGANNIRVVYRHLPLPFHTKAKLAAEASMAAHAQGKFWPYHDKLFANQEKLDKADLLRYAKELGLDMKKFQQALEKGTYKAIVNKDLSFASKLNVPGTPFFFINGRPVGENDTSEGVARASLVEVEALLKKGVKPEDVYKTLIQGRKQTP